jgi:superfamily II DNA helicase RecQ
MGRKINRVQYTLNPCKEELSINEIKAVLRASDAVIGTGGRAILAKILKGSKDKKLLELKLDQCPFYGFYRGLTTEQITSKIDWLIHAGYLEIEYDYRLPLLYFTDKGWEIEKETCTDELLAKMKALFGSSDLDLIDTLKDKDRKMMFLLLDKIEAAGDPQFVPLLEYWKTIDYKKVQAKINGVIKKLEGGAG